MFLSKIQTVLEVLLLINWESFASWTLVHQCYPSNIDKLSRGDRVTTWIRSLCVLACCLLLPILLDIRIFLTRLKIGDLPDGSWFPDFFLFNRETTRKNAKRSNSCGDSVSTWQFIDIWRITLVHQSSRGKRLPVYQQKNFQDCLNFAQKHNNWEVKDWKRVLWSNECPMELYATPNWNNNIVWRKITNNVPRILTVKFPQKLTTYVALRTTWALIILQGQIVNSLYFRNEILAKTCRDAINRTVDFKVP